MCQERRFNFLSQLSQLSITTEMDIAIGIVAKGSITAPRLHENIRTDGSPNVVSASVITPQLNAKVRNSTVSVGDEVVLPETLQDSPEAVLSAQADKEWMETAQELRNSRKRNTQQGQSCLRLYTYNC